MTQAGNQYMSLIGNDAMMWCYDKVTFWYRIITLKVHIFWEGYKILRNLPLTFDCSTYSQKLGEDFAKFCSLLRKDEL